MLNSRSEHLINFSGGGQVISLKSATALILDRTKLLILLGVSDSLPIKRYDIDFGGNVMAGIEIKGQSLKVFGAMNRYGDGIDDERIKITERRQ